MRPQLKFTPEMEALLIKLYPDTCNEEITRLTGWGVHVLKYHSKRLGIKKTRECKARTAGQTLWPAEKIQFIRDNYFKLTNRQLADAVGVTLTILRNKTRELGLKNYDLQYWTADQAQFLMENYKTLGDTDIAALLQERWPREKPWTRKHVKKKRDYLQLFRSQDEVTMIISKHCLPGGRSYTILNNSSSKNLPDRYVANCISRERGLKDEILKHPDLIQIKRQQIRLNRAIRKASGK